MDNKERIEWSTSLAEVEKRHVQNIPPGTDSEQKSIIAKQTTYRLHCMEVSTENIHLLQSDISLVWYPSLVRKGDERLAQWLWSVVSGRCFLHAQSLWVRLTAWSSLLERFLFDQSLTVCRTFVLFSIDMMTLYVTMKHRSMCRRFNDGAHIKKGIVLQSVNNPVNKTMPISLAEDIGTTYGSAPHNQTT